MRKAVFLLIGISLVVLIGANLFIGSQETEAVPPPEADSTTLRSTTSGDVVGFRDKGARAWLGIPFAQAPVDELRWRAPQPPVPAAEVLQALAPGNICPQFTSLLSGGGESGNSGVSGDEDCLYLNVWSPPNAAKLPVMFWIHGGGNTIGDGGSYNGATLAYERDVVVVTINYRLGLFGWFNHPGLKTGDPLDDSGNYANLDIIRALQWVQNNINRFGGNAGNVTVFGESAGAFDTLAMMASPLAKDLFHRAIVQSGGFSPTPISVAQAYEAEGGHPFSAQEIVAKMLVADGTVADAAAAQSYQADLSPTRLRDYLYNKPATDFFRIFDGGGFGMINLPDNFADGHVLPDLTTQEIFSDLNNHNAVPVILGTNRDEPALFIATAHTENFLGFLPRLKDKEEYKRIVKYGALAWKERGVDSLAEYMTQAGNPDVFAYRWDWDEQPSQFGYDLSTALGAAHALEIPFVFGDFEGGIGLGRVYPNDGPQQALTNSMMSYWTEFAYAGDPGDGRDGQEVAWLRWGENGKRSIILDTPADQGIFMDDALVTIASIKSELAGDDGFTDPAQQCALYVRNLRGHFDEAEYRALNPACADLDPAQFTGF